MADLFVYVSINSSEIWGIERHPVLAFSRKKDDLRVKKDVTLTMTDDGRISQFDNQLTTSSAVLNIFFNELFILFQGGRRNLYSISSKSLISA